jgi:hypothetical protein
MNETFQRDEFTKRPEIIFITYDEVIKNPYPFLLKQILSKYKKNYENFIDLASIENMDDKNLMRFCVQRTNQNIFRELAKVEFDYDKANDDLYSKFDDMFLNSSLLSMGKNIPFLLAQKFTKKIYVYTRNYDKRVHLDLEMNFHDMDKIKYVVGDFDEVISSLDGITSYILNDANYIIPIIYNKKIEYTTVLVANYGYNYAMNEDEQMVLKINVADILEPNIFKFATFMPEEFTEEHFTNL